jgi:CBS domain-containing protein
LAIQKYVFILQPIDSKPISLMSLPNSFPRMSSVANILQKKHGRIISVEPTTSVFDAIHLMAEKNIGSVIVATNGTYLGIVTERDYTRKVILQDKHSSETTVTEIMSTDLPRVSPRDTHEVCMKLMAERNVRYLPVFENGTLVGIVSILDVIEATVDQQKETIGSLQDFISSNFG